MKKKTTKKRVPTKKEFKIGKYTLKINSDGVDIKVKGHAIGYHIVLADEGPVVDCTSNKGIVGEITHWCNEEILTCEYCGNSDCEYDCLPEEE